MLFILISLITAIHVNITRKIQTASNSERLSESQSGSATEEDLRDVQTKIDANEDTLRTHKEEATTVREYYSEMMQKCSEGWTEISRLSQE